MSGSKGRDERSMGYLVMKIGRGWVNVNLEVWHHKIYDCGKEYKVHANCMDDLIVDELSRCRFRVVNTYKVLDGEDV